MSDRCSQQPDTAHERATCATRWINGRPRSNSGWVRAAPTRPIGNATRGRTRAARRPGHPRSHHRTRGFAPSGCGPGERSDVRRRLAADTQRAAPRRWSRQRRAIDDRSLRSSSFHGTSFNSSSFLVAAASGAPALARWSPVATRTASTRVGRTRMIHSGCTGKRAGTPTTGVCTASLGDRCWRSRPTTERGRPFVREFALDRTATGW